MPNPKKAIGRLFCITVSVCSLLMTMTGQTPQTPLASKFTSKDGRFSVKLPAEPTTKSEDISSDNGPSTLHTFTVEINGGKSFFLIGYSDYNTKLDVANSLDGVITAQVSGMKGKITSDKTVTLKGYSGRSVTIETEDTVFYSTVYIAGNRLYQLMFGKPKEDPIPPEAKEFFDSFEILS